MTVLVLGQWCWGHANDLAAAKKNFQRQGGVLSRGYSVLDFGADLEFAGVDDLGRVFWTGDGEPSVTEHRRRAR